MPNLPIPPIEFPFEKTWDALKLALKNDLENVSVEHVGIRDFTDDGKLIPKPPMLRIDYVGDDQVEQIDNRGVSYNVDQVFGILCADQSLSGDAQEQRRKSANIASRAARTLIGKKLCIEDGVETDTVRFKGIQPIPIADLGIGYVLVVAVPVTKQFCQTHEYQEG